MRIRKSRLIYVLWLNGRLIVHTRRGFILWTDCAVEVYRSIYGSWKKSADGERVVEIPGSVYHMRKADRYG